MRSPFEEAEGSLCQSCLGGADYEIATSEQMTVHTILFGLTRSFDRDGRQETAVLVMSTTKEHLFPGANWKALGSLS